MEDLLDMPLIVGEWSLATDNCAMWLNGFNDNLCARTALAPRPLPRAHRPAPMTPRATVAAR